MASSHGLFSKVLRYTGQWSLTLQILEKTNRISGMFWYGLPNELPCQPYGGLEITRQF